MASQPRTVVYLAPTGLEVREITDVYKPTGSQSLVKVEYSGINPADVKHATIGLHSSVAGYDFAGEVVEVGPTSPFKLGDKIFGHNPAFPAKPLFMGAHQDLALAADEAFHLVPTDRMGMHEAAVLPVVTATGADSLFNVLGLGFPVAGIEGKEKQSLLIWGASSAVGVAALQLAVAAGHGPIWVTASETHHATLKSLGADFCFDYKDPKVVEKIRESVKNSGHEIDAVLDTVCAGSMTVGDDYKQSSTAKAAECASRGGEPDDHSYNFVGVLPALGDKRWKMAGAGRTTDPRSPFQTDDLDGWKLLQRKVMVWVTQNYGPNKFVFPNVRIVKGLKAGMEAMELSAQGKSSLEKFVVEHPL